MRFVVLDIEATCWQNMPLSFEQETIEIGACLIDPFGHIDDTFSKFIKPVLHPVLSHYCCQLTNIRQDDVNRAEVFRFVMEDFFDWVQDDEDFLVCTWGSFDRKQLYKDCKRNNIPTDWLDNHLNIKEQYQEMKKWTKGQVGIRKAIELEGFDWHGKNHRALDDAYNLAKIVSRYIDNWRY